MSEFGRISSVCGTDAAKKSARSQYDQYSRLGIGSRRDAGSERRLNRESTREVNTDLQADGHRTYRFATSDTPISLEERTRHVSNMSCSFRKYPRPVLPLSLPFSQTHFFSNPKIILILLCSPAPVSGTVAGASSSSVNWNGTGCRAVRGD